MKYDMEELITVVRDSFNPGEYAEAAKVLATSKTKGKGNTWIAIGVITLIGCGIAYYLYKKNQKSTKPSKSSSKSR